MIEIQNLTKKYVSDFPPKTTVALEDVSLKLHRGEIVGLFGENGAGKTTFMKCILGLIGYEGEIFLDGEPITRKNIEKLSFATCEHSFFPGLTPKGHMEFYQEHFPKFRQRRFEGLMEFFGLPMDQKIKSFSTGQKNQFEVILALCQGADFIFMDEPFAGNDIFNREDFYKVLMGILEPEETVILSTHLIEEVADFIGRAILIRRGRVVGDADVLDLEEQGISLMDYIRKTYHYKADRVSKALGEITGEEG